MISKPMPGRICLATPLQSLLAARVLDENTTHGLSGRGEEVAAAVPALGFLSSHQAKVRLVDQCGGLKRLSRFLFGQPFRCQLT